MLTASETATAFNSRNSLILRSVRSSLPSISGQLRLETSHLTLRDTMNCSAIKLRRSGMSSTHSSSPSRIINASASLLSFRIFLSISVKANHAFASSNAFLPSISYLFRTCDTSDGCCSTSRNMRPLSTDVALLIFRSVAWQKK